MVRVVCLVLATAAFLAAAALVTGSVTTSAAGERISCDTVATALEVGSPQPGAERPAAARQAAAACHGALVDRTLLAGLTALVALAAAGIAEAIRRDELGSVAWEDVPQGVQ